MIQKGAVQTTFCFWCWFLVMGFLFVILRKRSRNKTVKINIFHMSQVIWKDRWGICSHFFPWDAVKVSTMIQKGAVQTTFCFWCWFWWWVFYLWFLEKDQETKLWRSTFSTCHKSFEKIGGGSVHIFSMGCCKSVHYDSKGCCSNNILFLMFLLHYSKVISYNVQSNFSDVSPRPMQKNKSSTVSDRQWNRLNMQKS